MIGSHRKVVVATAILGLIATGGCAASGESANIPTASAPLDVGAETPASEPAEPSGAAPVETSRTSADAVPDTPASGDQLLVGGSADARLLAHLYLALNVNTSDEARWSLSAGASEADVAACMGESGFQYVPGDDAAGQLALSQTMPADEFAARFGFGATAYGLGLIDDTVVEPNGDYLATLSPAEQEAFDSAVRACLESAPTGNPDAVLEPGGSAAIAVVVDRYGDVITNDERVIDALAKWKTCLSESGFDFDAPDAMRASFFNRQVGLSTSELQTLYDEEIAVSIANVSCEAPYRDVYRQVVADRFGEFQTMYGAALASGASPDGNG